MADTESSSSQLMGLQGPGRPGSCRSKRGTNITESSRFLTFKERDKYHTVVQLAVGGPAGARPSGFLLFKERDKYHRVVQLAVGGPAVATSSRSLPFKEREKYHSHPVGGWWACRGWVFRVPAVQREGQVSHSRPVGGWWAGSSGFLPFKERDKYHTVVQLAVGGPAGAGSSRFLLSKRGRNISVSLVQ